MKKIPMILMAMILLSFTTQNEPPKEKVYKIELSQSEVVNLYNAIDFCRGALKTSQAPAVSVSSTIGVLDSIQKTLARQFNDQVAKDTTNLKAEGTK